MSYPSAMLNALALLLLANPAPAAPPTFSDVAVYNGAWTITATKTMAGAGKTDSLVNHCTQGSAYYACEQVVNGDMPESKYAFIHRKSKPTEQERDAVCKWTEDARQ